jgi:hypothetical protein
MSALSERLVLEKDIEITQAGFQFLRTLELNDFKAKILRLLNICWRVVDEETFPGGPPNLIEQDSKDLGFWFYMSNFARNHHIVE